MAIRKVIDFYSQGLRYFRQLLDGPGTIVANTYLRGNASATALEFSNTIPAFVGWQFVDANAQIISLGSGTLVAGATTSFTLTSAIVDVNTGQFYANNGMYVGAPAANARTPFGAVEVANLPGVYFRNSAPNDGGWITFEDQVGPSIVRHRWGIEGSPYNGDFRHTDEVRYCRWDASANLFTLESADGTNVHEINGAGTTVFNQQGSDLDFRIEGDTDTEIFFIDASTDRVGISTTTPSQTLDVQGNVNVSGEMMGSRFGFQAGLTSASSVTTSGYMRVGTATMSATIGVVMTRPGSVTGVSGITTASGFVGSGNMVFESRINNSVVLSATVNVTGAGTFSQTATQARNTSTFVAGDVIQLSFSNAGVYNKSDILVNVDVQYDT